MCLNSGENDNGQNFNFKILFYRGIDKGGNDRGYYGNSKIVSTQFKQK